MEFGFYAPRLYCFDLLWTCCFGLLHNKSDIVGFRLYRRRRRRHRRCWTAAAADDDDHDDEFIAGAWHDQGFLSCFLSYFIWAPNASQLDKM